MFDIVGILNLNGESVYLANLHKMTKAIAHRSFDDEGHSIDGNVDLGRHRLVQNRIRCKKKPNEIWASSINTI